MGRYSFDRDAPSESEPQAQTKQVACPWFVQVVRRDEDGREVALSERFETEEQARQWLAQRRHGDGFELAAYQEFVDGHWRLRMVADVDVDGRAKVAEVREMIRDRGAWDRRENERRAV